MFAWQNNESSTWDLQGLQVTNYSLGYDVAKFDLELGLHEVNGRIVGSLSYATSLFKQETMERHIGYLEMILRAMVVDTDQDINSVDLLSSVERTLILHTWNETQEHYPNNMCVHHLFEQQVDRTPDSTAVVYEDKTLTYAELNARANSLAHHLISLGVQPDDLVAICVERSLEMIIGVLAILKAGGAYVPLDPSHASERLRDILCDASPVCLVADNGGLTAIGEAATQATTLVELSCTNMPQISSNPRILQLTPSHLAYVIYTSGTTGRPKGVMVEHQGVANIARFRHTLIASGSCARVSQFFSFSFDASVVEIFPVITIGGTLHLLSDRERYDRNQLWGYLEKHSITDVLLTPAVLQDCKDLKPLTTPTTFVLAGEAPSASLVQALQGLVPNCTIINEYGPTEATVAATVWRYQAEHPLDLVPIGRPIANKCLYILDTNGNPVPVGVVGELYIGGVGVARGYLNRPDLTAERFHLDPFAANPKARMYKTGDLARYLPDGNVVYLGRNDDQVKIRGFRIELGEIEARLRDHPMVAEAVVVTAGEENNKRLVAYIVTRRDEQDADTVEGGNCKCWVV
jgi:amino acid adenylation domain-containing protein